MPARLIVTVLCTLVHAAALAAIAGVVFWLTPKFGLDPWVVFCGVLTTTWLTEVFISVWDEEGVV